MKEIKERFETITEKRPNHSSMICFIGAVWGRGYTRQLIRTAFNKLVQKDDYARSEKQEILEWIYSIAEKNHKKKVAN